MALRGGSFRLLALLALVTAALALPSKPAAATVGCSQRLIDDWSDNGRVDRVYGLDCYLDAVESMPPDIRDYTDAQDTIERAFQSAQRVKGGGTQRQAPAPRSLAAAQPVDTSGSATVPLPLLALGALGSVALLGGALTLLVGRARLGRKDGAR
jgi:hypothetical protein